MDLYVSKVCPAYPGTPAAARNVAYWLARGHAEAEIETAIDNYAADMRLHKKPPRYRRAPVNFFCRAEPTFLGYTTPRKQQESAHRRPTPPPDDGPTASSATIREMLAKAGFGKSRRAAVG